MNSQNVFKMLLIAVLKDLLLKGVPTQKIKSPIVSMFEVASRYDLVEMIKRAVLYDEIPVFARVKNNIKQMVWSHEINRWKTTCLLYKELLCYSDYVSKIVLHPWWYFVKHEVLYYKKVAAILSILMGGQPSGLQRNYRRTQCKLCHGFAAETNEHIILECTSLQKYRHSLWNSVISSMNEVLKLDMISRGNKDKVCLMLSCYKETYVAEWNDLYKSTANFIYTMYVRRAEAYDSLE